MLYRIAHIVDVVWIQRPHIGSRQIQIAVFPAFMMLMKLDTILEEIIRFVPQLQLSVQEKTATRASRCRKSLYRGLSHFEIAEQQQAAVPRAVHMGAAGCKFLFGSMFLLIAMVQLVVQNNTTCEPLLWDSCVVKTPFSGNAVPTTCNCAVLNVRKHNWTALPKEIQQMNALKSDANQPWAVGGDSRRVG